MKRYKTCIVCKSSQILPVFRVCGIQYWSCQRCTHVFSYRVLESPYEDYKHVAKYEKWKSYLHNIFLKRTYDILKYMPAGKVLEVGCSLGFFLDVLTDAGFTAEGLEPSDDAVRIGTRRGLKISKGYLENNTLQKGTYDVVILNHVMEHIPNLTRACECIQTLLSPKGIVFIESPNFASIEGKFRKEKWRYLYPQEHYSQFSPKSLQTLLLKNGFTILSCKTYASPFDFGAPARELLRCLKERDWKRLVTYGIEFPLAIVEMITGQGTAVQCIAQKKKV